MYAEYKDYIILIKLSSGEIFNLHVAVHTFLIFLYFLSVIEFSLIAINWRNHPMNKYVSCITVCSSNRDSLSSFNKLHVNIMK